ncbi:MAG: cbb3-type cytochrome c oxidase subunit II [Chthoniobacterales bacterium]
MKGLQPLFLGIFGIFAFSWLGMTVVPNLQIGSLNPQTDEDGGDVYPSPPSGMALRGARVYAENGCVYCHSQQVRPEYGGSDIERKWGVRRSAPRDYIFQPVVFLGKMRTGPDLANIGARPGLEEKGAATPPTAGAAASPPAGAPATGVAVTASPVPGSSPAASTAANQSPAGSPASATASPSAGSVAAARPAAAASPTKPSQAASGSPAVAAASPNPAVVATSSPSGSPTASGTAPASLPPAGDQPAANVATSAPSMVADVKALTENGQPIPYSAAWHHRHLYNPRSIAQDSNMPAYRFLYTKHRTSGEGSPDAINFAGSRGEDSETGWEIVPSYDAKCLVAYLMSLNQSHALKEAKAAATIAAPVPAPGKEAQK